MSTSHDEKSHPASLELKTHSLSPHPEDDEGHGLGDTPLPSPAIASTPKPKKQLSAAAIIPIWICLSSTVIIYNNYLYNTLDFKYPVFLVTWHLTFAVSTLLLPPLTLFLPLYTRLETKVMHPTNRPLEPEF